MALYYSNAEVDRYNARGLGAADNVVCYPACDGIAGYKNKLVYKDELNKVAKRSASDMVSLPASIYLSFGKPYVVTANIDVSDGLVNENMGTLWYIERFEHSNLLRLWLEFPTDMVGIVVAVPARKKYITTAHPQ